VSLSQAITELRLNALIYLALPADELLSATSGCCCWRTLYASNAYERWRPFAFDLDWLCRFQEVPDLSAPTRTAEIELHQAKAHATNSNLKTVPSCQRKILCRQ